MKTAIRWGAFLVIAMTSAASLADEQQLVWMERYPDAEGEVTRRGASAAMVEPSRAEESDRNVEAGTSTAAPTGSTDERTSFDERWLREREGYRDGGY